jgi:hypothetical protein
MPKLREPNLLSYIEKVWRERERETGDHNTLSAMWTHPSSLADPFL